MSRTNHTGARQYRRDGARGRRGFTLIETALATTVIGVAIAAVLNLLAIGTASNTGSVKRATGMNLTQNIREMCVNKTIDEVAALAGTEYSPPRDAAGEVLEGYDNWVQRIDVNCVDVNQLSLVVPAGSSPALRVTTSIRQNGKDLCSVSWLLIKAQE